MRSDNQFDKVTTPGKGWVSSSGTGRKLTHVDDAADPEQPLRT
jgi:hypothetical protein